MHELILNVSLATIMAVYLLSFYLFDRLLRLESVAYPEQWKSDGNPVGVFTLARTRRGFDLAEAKNARMALKMAKSQGRSLAYSYQAIAGPAHYDFIGVVELLFLDLGYFEPNEVWLEFTYRVTPMERKAKLTRPDKDLHAISSDPRTCSGRAYAGPVRRLALKAARH